MTDKKSFQIRTVLYLMIALTLTLLLIHSAGSSPAGPSTITVDDDGGQDYTTIQYAIDNASDGDIIQVYPGTYEKVDVDKQLTITSTNGAAVTHIVASSGSVVALKHDNINFNGFNISGGMNGIYINSDNNTLTNNTVSDSSYCNVYIFNYCFNSTFINNTLSKSSSQGIYISRSRECTFINNTITDSAMGLNMYMSGGCTFRNNTFTNNDEPIIFTSLPNDVDTSNTIDGKPIYYLVNESDISIGATTNAGLVHCINCTNITVESLNITNQKTGIYFYTTNNSTIINSTVSGNEKGVFISISYNNTIMDNRLVSNKYGLYVDNAKENTLYNNYLNNTNDNVRFNGDCSGNVWNITKTAGQSIAGGPFLGGNYWLKPDGTGFSQTNSTDLNADQICDDAYTISAGQIDHLPLLAPPVPITVDDDGGQDYTTIQQAIDTASNGDIIQVYPGTYTETLVVEKQLTITSTNGAAVTHIMAADIWKGAVSLKYDGITFSGFNISGASKSKGIYVASKNNIISNNSISDNRYNIYIHGVDDNKIINNTLSRSTDWSIYISAGDNNTFINNTITDNEKGLASYMNEDCTFRNTTLINNTDQIRFSTNLPNDIDTSNTVDGRPIYYLVNESDISIGSSTNAYLIHCIDCTNITVEGLNFTNNANAITFHTTNDSAIKNNTLSENENGVFFSESYNNAIMNNRIVSNNYGFYFQLSKENTIYNNYLNNTNNVYLNMDCSGNVWNITKTAGQSIAGGPFLGGNYWLKPDGTGFSQTNTNDLNADQICDDAYTVDLNSGQIDHLPLLAPPGPITVDDDGGKDYTTIQQAIDNASDGNIIQVYPGTYTENVNVTKQLTLTSVNGASVTYIVAASKTDHAVNIFHDNVTINGFNISGATDWTFGIRVDSMNNTITNNNLSRNYVGIYVLKDQNNNTLINNVISDSSYSGLTLNRNGGHTLTNNTYLNNNAFGIYIKYSWDNIFRNNSIINNRNSIVLGEYSNDIDTSNTINGKPIYYLKNESDISIGASADPGMVYCLNCINITVKDLNLTENSDAIYFSNTTYSTIENNTLSSNNDDIKLEDSNHNRIINNSMLSNYCGIYFDNSRENTIYNNNFSNRNYNVKFVGICTGNIWNTTKTAGQNIAGGPFLGGNYWLKSDGTGFSQINNTDLNLDGICDETYTIESGKVDYLPLAYPDIIPPASVTDLSESTNGSTWINWTWTNPADVDFNYTMVYLNGTFKVNVTGTAYNATGLTDNTNYMIQTRTVDIAGNINSTWINDTASTLNTLPPSSITDLSESTNGSTWINWTWTNPTDTDLNYTMVYLNGTFKENITGTYYNATGLTDNTNYILQTKTVDTAGNINSTWVNDTASTLNTLPPSSITGLSESANASTWINWTWTNPTDTDFNYTMVYLNDTFKANVTGTYYNATGLSDNTNYMLQTRTVDIAGNINSTWVNDTASTMNTLPPSSITGLSESTNGSTWINWTWTNPADTDLNYTMVYLNGTFKENVTGTYYNATGLTDNTNYILQTRTVDTADNINTTWINDTASTLNTLPPSSITGLSESANGSTWINWTWTNPTDTDFNYTMVYLNDTFKANVTGTYYNATGLSDNTNYMLQTRTVDIAGNINSTWVNDTANTMNTLPPASVTGLTESTNGSTWINWTWTNPTDTDFNYTMVYLNGTFKANVTGTAYNATGLTDNTNYMLQTKTVDTADNINSTWINDTASTLNTLPPSSITGLSESANGSTWINWTWTNPTDTDFNHTMVYLNGTFKANVTGTAYNATGLSDNTNYILQTKTVDTAGNINSTWVNDTANTMNTLPPASITNLSSSTGSSWINWAWTNPADRDHNYSMVYLNGVFRINVSGDSYSATNLQSSRNYEISIRTVDTAGNINTTWINDTATTTAESSGSRSSVGQSMPPQEVASTDTGVKKVLAGADVNFDLSSGEGPVLGISFKANSNEGNVVATVQVLNERPAGVTGEPTGRRYQTMSITVGREGTISKDNADNINIKFKVSKEWIRENGIDPATIRMTRYHDGAWNDLPTDGVDEDDEYYYFSALTPGFSVFEVVGDEATQQTQQTAEVDTQPATSPEQQTTQQTVPEEEEEESGLPGFTAVWGTIMLSLAAVGRRYRK